VHYLCGWIERLSPNIRKKATKTRAKAEELSRVDEACASVRVQLDSQPELIDKLERRELQLDIETTALQAEKDEASQARLAAVKEELARIREELKPLRLQHEAEKNRNERLREASSAPYTRSWPPLSAIVMWLWRLI
jgi:ATP-dependent Clp protease ATP-binding subunit ClpA